MNRKEPTKTVMVILKLKRTLWFQNFHKNSALQGLSCGFWLFTTVQEEIQHCFMEIQLTLTALKYFV